MNIIVKSNFKQGSFVDILLKGDNVEICSGTIVETLPRVVFGNLFARRNHYKGIVENGKVKVIRYVDFHRHTAYSLLDGATSVSSLIKHTEWAGAILDHGVMYGTLEYYKGMKDAGKKPIIGFEAYVESFDGTRNKNHMPLIARNYKGYLNLVKLTGLGYENFYIKPQLKYQWLREHSEGVIATSGCAGGEIPRALRNGDYKLARKVAEEFISIFGKESFFIEVQRHGIDFEEKLNNDLIALAKELGLKVIATTDSHYTLKEDSFAHEIMLCLQTGKTISDDKRFKFPGTGYHLHSSEEMSELWKDMPEVLDNTLDLAEEIDLEIELGKVHMPSFPLPEGFNSDNDYFVHLCEEGFKKRFEGTDKYTSAEYRERLQFEIDTILKMEFPGYFIIVWDFVNFAKSRNILVGPGRGSACGSLVAYCLFITEIEPIRYGLLFERFLNVDRVSLPDIDLDFQDDRREEVIDYVKGKYGEKAVSRIITFGTLAARAVIRDLSRVLEKGYSFGDRIAKSIPKTPKITLKKALEESQEFYNLYTSEEEVKEVVDLAMKLEGLPRNVSQHACGVLIAPGPVSNYIPQILIEDEKTGLKELTTQYTMTECEERGILKMDFLGLRTMGVIGNSLKDINKKRAVQGLEPVTYQSIPLNDVKVYEFISKGNTEGVFQLESQGMTAFMTQLFQDVPSFINVLSKEELYKKGEELFERAIAGISLYRPGPIDEIPNYINHMLHPETIKYEVPALKGILDNTYSVIVYQEQCMFIVRELAGFSKGQADTIRKAMAKKKHKILDEYEEYFVYGSENHDSVEKEKLNILGCVANGISEHVAKGIWDKMKKFGEYAFNKSHAGGYADIAVRTGWLALYYPAEYMCATLNSYIDKADKIKLYMAVCKKKGIKILPPDVNHSEERFSIVDDAIRFGLMGIKNMGSTSISVIEERKARGEFKTFQDFAERMSVHHKVDKSVLEALVYSGAVDSFEGTRKAKISMLKLLQTVASAEKKKHVSGQIDIFDLAKESGNDEILGIKKIPVPVLPEFPKRFKLEKEKEYAGFYVTEHPLDEYSQYFDKQGITEIGFISSLSEEGEEDHSNLSMDGESIKIAGIIKDMKVFYTKTKNEPMNVFTIEDRTGELKAVVFPKDREKNLEKLSEGKIVIANGEMKVDDRGTQIIVKTLVDVDALRLQETPESVWMKGSNNRLWARKQWKEIEYLAQKNPGDVSMFFSFGNEKHLMKCNIKITLSVMVALQDMLGENNVKIMYKR